MGKLNLIPGLRYDILQAGSITTDSDDEVEGYKSYHLSPKIAGIYQITDNDTLKVSYARGFNNIDAAVWQ